MTCEYDEWDGLSVPHLYIHSEVLNRKELTPIHAIISELCLLRDVSFEHIYTCSMLTGDTFQLLILHVWLRITDEGSVPEMRIWSISLI